MAWIEEAWPANLQPADCPDGVDPEAVRCATLQVPENYSEPDGRSIDLYLTIVPAVQANEAWVPLAILAGGPGNSIAGEAGWYLEEGRDWRLERPLILLDQRGTGFSNPLHCPRIEAQGSLENDYASDLVEACREQLSGKNDLRHFGTREAAQDLDRVREALGYEQIDLWGISYGTILAQAYLRAFPTRVRSAVLVGTALLDSRFPLYHASNAQRALDLLFFECQSDPACSAAYPDLRDDWQKLLNRLDRDPPEVTLQREGGEPWMGALGRGIFAEDFRGLLGSTGNTRRVPWIIHEAANDNFAPLLEALAGPPDDFFSYGLYLSVTCAEATARIESAQIEPAVMGTFLGDYRVREQIAACSAWPRAEIAKEFFQPVISDVPVLLLVGEMDATTPPMWSYQVARGLSQGTVVSMPYGGHLFWDWGEDQQGSECFDNLALAFYASGDAQALDTSCAQNVVPPPFLVPGQPATRH